MPPYVLTSVRLGGIEQNDEYLRAADKTGADAEAILAHIRQVHQLPPLACSMSAAGEGPGHCFMAERSDTLGYEIPGYAECTPIVPRVYPACHSVFLTRVSA